MQLTSKRSIRKRDHFWQSYVFWCALFVGTPVMASGFQNGYWWRQEKYRLQQSQRDVEISSLATEARREVDKFARKIFVNCGGSERWYSMVQTAIRDYKILEVKNLKTGISGEESLSPADKANGIEWKGVGRLEAKISREYLPPSKSEWSNEGRGWQSWQDIEQGSLAVFSIEKRNGRWLIDNKDSSSFEGQCAPTCELLQTPDRLHKVIEDRLYEIVALQNRLNRRLTGFPFVLCASYHDYLRNLSGIEEQAAKGLSNEVLPSESQFLKAAEQAAKEFVESHYVKCGQHYYTFFSRGPIGADACLVRFDNVTWSVTTGKWVTEADYSESREETGGKIIKRSAQIQLKRSGQSAERCVPGRILLLDEGYHRDAWWFEGGRYYDKIPLLYSKDKRGEQWSSLTDGKLTPPTCEKILFAWDSYKQYR